VVLILLPAADGKANRLTPEPAARLPANAKNRVADGSGLNDMRPPSEGRPTNILTNSAASDIHATRQKRSHISLFGAEQIVACLFGSVFVVWFSRSRSPS
jgi:hypothetical protein